MSQREGLERRAYWDGVIQQQAASGLSISAFCREHGVAEGSFFYWRRKLTEGQPQAVAGAESEKSRAGRSVHKTTAKFVPVEIPAPTGSTRANCEVVLPNGCRVIVPTQCDAGLLREILDALGNQAC